MKRTSMDGAECPVARALDVIGDWWTLLIVRDALDGMRRFGEFQRSLGISKGILATRLKALVEADILRQGARDDGGAHLDYVLTDKGRGLFLVLVGLRQWGEAHCFAPAEPHSILVENQTGGAVRPLRLEAAAGHLLDDTSTMVQKVGEVRSAPMAATRNKGRKDPKRR